MPCSDPMPTDADRKWQQRYDASARAAMELLCSGDEQDLWDALGLPYAEWLDEHRAIDAERERLKAAGSYYVR